MASLEERRRRDRRRAERRVALQDPNAVIHLPPGQEPKTTGALTNDSIAIQAPHVQEKSMKNPGLGAKFRYRFDNVMARGTGAIIGLLGLVTLIFILLVSAILEDRK